MAFRKDFVWGVSTASYQIEGAPAEDGKGLNIWDVFTSEKGKGRIYGDQDGNVADDEYHRYAEDIALIRQLGVKAYRFSISWARILPEGTGRVNEAGLAYYDKVVDLLLESGIEPYVTLYHWDLPWELQKKGGWMNPESPEWFREYTEVIARHFCGRVRHYFTVNEPQCAIGLGYYTGQHAPGLKVGEHDFFAAWVNLLKAHGEAVSVLREQAGDDVRIGAAPCSALYFPETDSEADIEAARKAMFSLSGNLNDDLWNISLWSDPVFLGSFSEDTVRFYGKYLPEITEEEWKKIAQPLDYYGQNMYNAVPVHAGANGEPERVRRYDGFPRTGCKWPVTPEVMYWAPKYLYERYHAPIIITENGMTALDWVALDGKVHDECRIDFLHRYLNEYKRCAEDGIDIRGYFLWSIIDNFEWFDGYSERFGIVYVDFPTQKRTPKESYYYYQNVVRTNGECL